MLPLVALAIGAGLGLLKSQTVDKAKEENDRYIASETQRYSPWTHLQAQPIHESDAMGSALQFGATGAQLGGAFENSEAQNKLMDAQSKWLNAGGSPQYTAQMGATSPWGAHGPMSGYNYNQSPESFWGVGKM